MAIGGAWKSWDEKLHPRDRYGRFAKKFKWSKSVIQKLDTFLSAFSPRTFQNDAQAAQYMFNQGSKTPWTRDEYARLHMDIDQANAHLRSGDMDDETKRFVQTMDAHKVPADSDLIISRTVDASAFGLTPEQLGLEDGGLEDFTGKLLADRAYNTGQIGGIITAGGESSGGPAGPGTITMRIAVPKGTPIIPFARHRDDRGMSFDRDQEFRITKVQPDGSGGYYVAAVATPRTKGDTPTPVNQAPSGVDLTPEQRAERVRSRAQMRSPTEIREEEQAQRRIAQGQAAEGPAAEARAKRLEDLRLRQVEEPAPVPQRTEQLPQGVEPRNEPTVPTPEAPAPAAVPEPAGVPPAMTPGPTPVQFRQAFRDAEIPSPSYGPRRREFNDALIGIGSGKKDPFDALRDLERDIEVNQNKQRIDPDPELEADIKAQQGLAQLIREQYNVPGREKAPEAPTPEPAKAVKKAATRAKKAVSSEGGTKAAGLTPEQQESVRNRVARMHSEGKFNPDNPEHQRLQSLVDQMKGPAKKAAPAKAPAAPAKAAAPEAPSPVSRRQLEVLRSTGTRGRVGIDERDLTNADVDELRTRGLIRTKRSTEEGRAEVILTPAGRKHLAGLDQQTAANRAAKKAAPEAPAKAVPEVSAEKPLEKNTIPELRDIAKTEGVELRSRMLKADIVKEIQHARTNRAAPRVPRTAEDVVTPADEAALMRREAETRREAGDLTEAKRLETQAERLETTPVKKVAKRAPKAAGTKLAPPAAAPEAPTGDDLDKMKRPELLAQATREGVVSPRRFDKESLKHEIRQRRAEGPTEEGSVLDKENRINELLGRTVGKSTTAEMRAYAFHRNIDLPKQATRAQLIDALLGTGKEDAARARQADFDRVRPTASALARLADARSKPMSKRAYEHTVRSVGRDLGPEFTEEALRRGPGGNLDDLIGQIEKDNKLTRVGRVGDVVPLDPSIHELPEGLRAGDKVEVISPPYRIRKEGDDLTLVPGRVVPADPDARVTRVPEARAKKLVPEGSVPGPVAQTPVTTSERRAGFRQAWDDADFKTPGGSAGRSMTEIRNDVSSGKITPEEGVRRMESEIALNQEELTDMDAALRTDLTPAERKKLTVQQRGLERAITEQRKASRFMRDHFRDEAPVSSVKELKKLTLEVPEDMRRALDDVKPEDLKDEAVRQGLERPKGDTVDEVIQDMARQIAKQELTRRVQEGAKAAKALKKAAPKKAAPVKAVPKVTPGKLDARTIAQGLEVDDKTLDEVQQALDGEAVSGLPKKASAPAIAKSLRDQAEAVRTSAVLRHGGWIGEASETPALKRERERQVAIFRRHADQIDQLADRIEGARRPRKAPEAPAPTKVIRTPEERKALIQANTEMLQARMTEGALERLGNAKTRSRVDDALAGMTVPDVRRVADQLGIKGRTRKQLVDGIAERYLGAPEAPAPVEAPTPEVVPGASKPVWGTVKTSGAKPGDIVMYHGGNRKAPSTEGRRVRVESAGRSGYKLVDPETGKLVTSSSNATRSWLSPPETAAPTKATKAAKKAAPEAVEVPTPAPTPATPLKQVAKKQATALREATGRPAAPSAPVKRAFQVTDGEGRIKKIQRANEDEPIHLPNGGVDQGLVHLDSSLGELWSDLYTDQREPNSFVNEIARLGEAVGRRGAFADIDKDTIPGLKKLKERASDPAIAARIQETIDALQAPLRAIDIPEGVPTEVRRVLKDLAKIPTARKTGHIGGNRVETSVLDQMLDTVRKISRGELTDRGEPERELTKHHLHESGDGAVQMWTIVDRLHQPKNALEIRAWIRRGLEAKQSRPTPSITEPEDTETRRLVDQIEGLSTHQAARAKIRSMGLDELRLIAQDKGIKDWQNLPKPALMTAIIDAMELFDPDER